MTEKTDTRWGLPVQAARGPLGNISTPTLYELINSGTLKTYKIGTRRYTTHAYIAECIRTLTERTMSGGKKRGTA
ncbi:DNA-binding protein [Methylocaldum sp. 14B]|jgi:hypothetical protein|uniref:DNA-binding protein n=1 Tax=Methylocaldum sp. 14B TaxID=1912213 RepID=UPI00098A2241|nr:DNA-binding protein [Methylocaldum sp. 14B]